MDKAVHIGNILIQDERSGHRTDLDIVADHVGAVAEKHVPVNLNVIIITARTVELARACIAVGVGVHDTIAVETVIAERGDLVDMADLDWTFGGKRIAEIFNIQVGPPGL